MDDFEKFLAGMRADRLADDPMDAAVLAVVDGGLADHAYSVRCRSCRFSRPRLGVARMTAFTSCASHGSRTGHTVDVRDNGVLIHTFAPVPRATLDDVPPF